jgi:ABC-2 type transport system permease protein
VKLRPIAAVALRQIYLMRSSPVRIMPMVAWVAVDIVLWGFIARYLNGVAAARVNFTASLLGAVLFWDFFSRVMQGVTMAFFEDIWSRNLINVFASPMLISEYLAGLVLTGVTTSFIGLIVMLIIAGAVFGLQFVALGMLLVPFLLVLFLFGIALGVLASAMVLRLGPASEWLVWPIPALLSPFVGVFYPLSTLPSWMRGVGHLLPPSYVFEDMRAVVAGQSIDIATLFISIALAALYVMLACLLQRIAGPLQRGERFLSDEQFHALPDHDADLGFHLAAHQISAGAGTARRVGGMAVRTGGADAGRLCAGARPDIAIPAGRPWLDRAAGSAAVRSQLHWRLPV